mmetsp:Transcript_100825/g.291546  ORF Transcript_100825/g.291546 Transcript_100825/m.291546 type:complete len:247 (-) Transcript_100825:1774-2514(-)
MNATERLQMRRVRVHHLVEALLLGSELARRRPELFRHNLQLAACAGKLLLGCGILLGLFELVLQLGKLAGQLRLRLLKLGHLLFFRLLFLLGVEGLNDQMRLQVRDLVGGMLQLLLHLLLLPQGFRSHRRDGPLHLVPRLFALRFGGRLGVHLGIGKCRSSVRDRPVVLLLGINSLDVLRPQSCIFVLQAPHRRGQRGLLFLEGLLRHLPCDLGLRPLLLQLAFHFVRLDRLLLQVPLHFVLHLCR